ncbi:PucR family transcriptional regulator [Nocardia aurantia]|nr:helix-turn-helix domain-containing protein [Nocardia aurantia]
MDITPPGDGSRRVPAQRRNKSPLPDVRAEARRLCGRFAASIGDDTTPDELADIVYEAARRWANAGLTHVDAHNALQDALREVIERLAAEPTPALSHQLRMIVAAAVHLPRTVLRAYYPQLQPYLAAPPAAGRALADSVLALGTPAGGGAAGGGGVAGVRIAAAYEVVAVQLRSGAPTVLAPMRRLLHGVRAHRDAVLSVVAESGGTVLIPVAPHEPARELDDLLATAATAADLTLTAAAVRAGVPELPAARQHAHELLDLVEQLGLGPGLYRVGDLAVEHQLAHGGFARDRLAAILDPLDPEPELLVALDRHIRAGGIGTRTAELLGLHPATVTRRMRRIRELTGIEPNDVFGLWRLRAALVARTTRPIDPAPADDHLR